jgi:hypothetical protein
LKFARMTARITAASKDEKPFAQICGDLISNRRLSNNTGRRPSTSHPGSVKIRAQIRAQSVVERKRAQRAKPQILNSQF